MPVAAVRQPTVRRRVVVVVVLATRVRAGDLRAFWGRREAGHQGAAAAVVVLGRVAAVVRVFTAAIGTAAPDAVFLGAMVVVVLAVGVVAEIWQRPGMSNG